MKPGTYTLTLTGPDGAQETKEVNIFDFEVSIFEVNEIMCDAVPEMLWRIHTKESEAEA